MSLSVRPVKIKKDLKKFIHFPWTIYKDDPSWIPPLLMEEKNRLNQKKNPFFQHAEQELFLAERDGKLVGRISAQVDHLHNKRHQDKTGFFGFFESINDVAVAQALLDKASQWLRERGMETIRGPFSSSINEESGLLNHGFEHSPYLLMPHHLAYYTVLLESCGLTKAKDLYCWRYNAKKPIPEMAVAIADEVAKYPGLKVREIDQKNLTRDLKIMINIFNEAWAKNWGFVPLTDQEVEKSVDEFRMIMDPRIVWIAEVEGKPAAICLCLPNLNEAIRDLNGRLFPLGIFKLLYRIKRHKLRSVRMLMLGVKKEFRGSILGGLSVLHYVIAHRRCQELGYERAELSWTLEDNEKINVGIQMMGGEHYKTYRVYEKTIAS
jgi:hypothetical protein